MSYVNTSYHTRPNNTGRQVTDGKVTNKMRSLVHRLDVSVMRTGKWLLSQDHWLGTGRFNSGRKPVYVDTSDKASFLSAPTSKREKANLYKSGANQSTLKNIP